MNIIARHDMVHMEMDYQMKTLKEKTIGVTEFKAKCLGLVKEVEKGRTKRVVLTKRGRPVAELTAARLPRKARPQSSFGDRNYGSAVMYRPGKVLIVGGGESADCHR